MVIKIILATCLVLLATSLILDSLIRKKIREQLTTLSASISIKFSRLHVRLLSGTVSFDSLEIDLMPDSDHPQNRHVLNFRQASIENISFTKFLLQKKITARNLLLEDGSLYLDDLLLRKDDSLKAIVGKIKWPFKSLSINNIELKSAKAFLHSTAGDQLLAQGNMKLGKLVVGKHGERPVFASIELSLSQIRCLFSNHKIEIAKLELNSYKKIFSIDSIFLFSGTQRSPQARISSIKITGFDAVKLLNDESLEAEQITVGPGRIWVSNQKIRWPASPVHLRKIQTSRLFVDNEMILYRDKASSCSFLANIQLQKLFIDLSFRKGNFHFQSVDASISNLQYVGDNYRNATVNKIEIDSKRESIVFTGVQVMPRINKHEFGRKLGHQADWIAASVPRIEITKPDLGGLLHQRMFAEKISIGESKVYIFRDRRLSRQQEIVPLPIDYIKTIPFYIRVKTLTLASSTVEYEEYPRSGYGQTGILRIEKIKLALSPLINHPDVSDPTYCSMYVNGSIMGSGTVHGIVMMPLRKNKPYSIRGAIERLELTRLNSSSENLGKIRIKSGFLDFLSFDFMMTSQRSTGKIVGAYHHLIIQQMKKHTDEKNVADFASFMLRHLIIPLNKDASLPERNRTGAVNYERDPTRFVSYYFLQSLLMGVKKSFTLGFLLPK